MRVRKRKRQRYTYILQALMQNQSKGALPKYTYNSHAQIQYQNTHFPRIQTIHPNTPIISVQKYDTNIHLQFPKYIYNSDAYIQYENAQSSQNIAINSMHKYDTKIHIRSLAYVSRPDTI